MDINALSNPYPRQDISVEALPVPVENPEQARQDPAARSLVVKNRDRAAPLRRKQTSDSVDIGSSSGGDSKQERHAVQYERLLYDMPRMKNWEHKLVAWFKTAITVQGSLPQNRGLTIDIIV